MILQNFGNKNINIVINIEEIKSRYEATTIAPWRAIIEGRDQTSGSSFIMTGVENINDVNNANREEDIYIIGGSDADIDFIANARQDILALVAEVERLNILLKKK